MDEYKLPKPQIGYPGIMIADLQFHQHEIAYGAVVIEKGNSKLPANLQERMSDWIETLKSTKHAVVDFKNGVVVSILTGTPVGATAFAKGDERVPTYEVSISKQGKEKDILFYQTPEQVNRILKKIGSGLKSSWVKIADETDEDLPEMVKAVYRKGSDLDRHLILLDEHGAGFFGLDLKPKPKNPKNKLPDAHVDIKVRDDRVRITFWDGDQRRSVTLTEVDPTDWKAVLDDARNSPASLVISELYHGELNGSGKLDRDEDD